MTSKALKPRIVVGLDGSAESREALRWAARLAPALGANVEAVAVWHWPVLALGPTESRSYAPPPEARMMKIARTTANEVLGPVAPRNLHIVVREGHPGERLVARTKGAALIVVGSRGLTGLKGRLQGSVSRYVSEHARCPVLVVRGPNDAKSAG